MERKHIVLSQSQSLQQGQLASIALPEDVLITSIHINVRGNYTLGNSTLLDEAAANILTLIELKDKSNRTLVSVSGKDLARMMYYETNGFTNFTASGGNINAHYVIDGPLITGEKLLPPNNDFPDQGKFVAPMLNFRWATTSDILSSGTGTLDSATAKVAVEYAEVMPEEITNMFGSSLEFYAWPHMRSFSSSTLPTTTNFQKALDLGSPLLLRSAVITVFDNAGARSNTAVSQLKLVKVDPSDEDLLRADFSILQEENRNEYRVNPLTGVFYLNADKIRDENRYPIGFHQLDVTNRFRLEVINGSQCSIRWTAKEHILHPRALASKLIPRLSV
ncbi:MAG: hypothetical protein QXM92_01805 [Candidatus Anstonellales archaeon]